MKRANFSTLRQKSIDGVIWRLFEKVGIQLIKLVLGVVLARLLTPADYGLIGMITVFFAISYVFIDSGFGLAYIQKKDADELDASTIFYFNLLVSALLYVVLWFTAPLIANFYDENQLISLIRVMSVVLILNSFSIIQLTKLNKRIEFKQKSIIILISAVLGSTCGIIAALLGFGVWSLVIQEVVRATIKGIGLWFFVKWRPLWCFNINSLKSMFSFSSWVFLMGIFTTIFDNLYTLVIGKFFSASQLGFFTKANQFQKTITESSTNVVGAVSFPVFSILQDDRIKLKKALQKFSQHTMFFVAPISAIFIVIAEPFFLILLKEKWLPMVPYFQLLLVAGVLYPIQTINVQILSALGKMKLNFALSMIKNSLRVLNVIITYKYGVMYIIYGEIIISFFSLVINTFYSKKFINYGMFEQLKDIAIVLLFSTISVGLGFSIMNKFENDYVKILLVSLILMVFYAISMYYFNKKAFLDNVKIIKSKFTKN